MHSSALFLKPQSLPQGCTPEGTNTVRASGTISILTGKAPSSSPSASTKTRAVEPGRT
jgi:hypothetical protein